MNQAASLETGHSGQKSGSRQARIDSVSFAEWRFETSTGHRAFARGDYENAAAHFAQAVSIAERLAAVASLGRADPGCAVRALIAARRNVAENYFRLGLVEESENALEMIFLQLCAMAKSPGSALQSACGCQVSAVSGILLAHLKNTFTSPARLTAIQAITEETLEYLRTCDAAGACTEQL